MGVERKVQEKPLEWVNPAELARLVGLSLTVIRGRLRAGTMAGARRFGRRWVIHLPTFRASFGGEPAPRPRLRRVGALGALDRASQEG